MPKLNTLFLSCAAALSLPIAADEIKHYQSFAGYTGLINIPNAEVMDAGIVDVGHNNQLDIGTKYIDGHNFILSAGLFEGVEVSGLVASNTMHDNIFYSEGRGQRRDLSFNIKYQVPYIPLDWFSFAIGAKDFEGASNKYKTFYAVASKELWDFRFSAGVGSSDRIIGQMDGAFAGIEWQPFKWFSLLTEYDSEAVNAAARLTIPKEWLYDIGEITLTSRFYSNTEFSEDTSNYWGINFTLPLSDEVGYQQPVKAAPDVQNNTANVPVASKGDASINPDAVKIQTQNDYTLPTVKPEARTTAKITNNTGQQAELNQLNSQSVNLKLALVEDGFENVSVAFNNNNQLFVKFENSIFNRNDIDALGLVLGRVAELITLEGVEFSVQLNKYDLALLNVVGTVDNYKEFITNNISPDLLITQGAALEPNGLVWVGTTDASSPYFKPRLTIAPTISNTYATELGVLDYSAAIRADLEVPLWQGGGIILGGQVNVANSDDYAENKPFKNYRKETQFDRALFYQTFELPFGFYNQTQVGYIKDFYDYRGISNETAWLSDAGRHKVSFKFGSFQYQDYRGSRSYQMFNYQYNWVEQDITLHAQAGDFWYEDSGYKLESRFWFGDSYLAVFFEDSSAQRAGAAISIPLSPRKDMSVTRFGQVKGNEAYRHSIGTQVGKSHNQLVFNQLYAPSSIIGLDKTFFNQGRLSSDYVYKHLPRLKEVYLKYR
ncbi:YjbH domain-containing protein [Pseudoalteromonas sp. SR41-4]|uniref:YjbH domain-containing protein n=1 Tax=Pseudoalteromonas sp. SR41-4 TaxID=2760950 RepID=UPI001601CBF1|nr:YjbH domain-containing protein [Pseudoalteromonas sp. SR41-4]MBB1295755.1 YjbH domain-containing protein [Pseudoalteromonas sp. SR41-4]